MLFDWSDFVWNIPNPIDMAVGDFITTYVPEAEYLPYTEALALAKDRDSQAAQELLESILEGEVM